MVAETSSSSASPLVDLIPELLAMIFECVYAADHLKHGLFACSLVSQYWEVVSRHQRFRKMSFCLGDDPNGPTWDSFDDHSSSSSECIGTTDSHLLDAFAASPSTARVTPWIRELMLSFGKTGRKRMHNGYLKALSLMPQLHTLKLRGGISPYSYMYCSRALAPSTQKITRLVLAGPPSSRRRERDDRFHSFALFDILDLFPSITMLEINHLCNVVPASRGQDDGSSQEPRKFPQPKTLVVKDAKIGSFLRATNLSSGVRSLTWNGTDDDHTAPLLPTLASKLEFLEVSTVTRLNLREFPALNHLTLHGYDSKIFLVPGFDRGAQQWTNAAAILSTAPKTLPLLSFHFIVKVEYQNHLSKAQTTITNEAHSIQSIEQSLVRLAAEGSLRDVAFEMQRGYDELIAAPNVFAAAFPHLVELGLLKNPPYNTHTIRGKLNAPPQSLAGW